MKRKISYIIIAAGMLLWAAGASAQMPQSGITVRYVKAEVVGNMLEIDVVLDAYDLNLGGNGQMKAELSIDGSDRRVVLPPVVYTGKKRYHFEERKLKLSGREGIQPYRVFKGVKKNRAYSLDYRMSVPYSEWMADASISLRKYTYGCGGDTQSGHSVLVERFTQQKPVAPKPVETKPEVWTPNPDVYRDMVYFSAPAAEQVKNRAASVELFLNYPANVSEVRTDYGNNRAELRKVDTLMRNILYNDIVSIGTVAITGYASPEGLLSTNERLAQRRAEGFRNYLTGLYGLHSKTSVNWVAEDWNGLRKLVEQSNMPYRAEVLSVISDRNDPDTKERILRLIDGGTPFRVMVQEMFPKLRRIELRTEYVVAALSDDKARELLQTDPGMLSLSEIYRAAQAYTPGSEAYRRAYETAARLYPDDATANNNAAAALLQEGDTAGAKKYLDRTENTPAWFMNTGVYHYILGEREKAAAMFTRARDAGIRQAEQNLGLLEGGQR